MSTDPTAPDPWAYLQEIGTNERHFNQIESTYRGLASTWVLASFAGMGWFATTAASAYVPHALGVFAISVAGSLGVQLLWLVDLLAYHHLLAAYFLEGLRLEFRNPALPQARWNMWKQGIVERRVKVFYAGCSLVTLPFGVTATVLSNDVTSSQRVAILVVAAVPVLMTVLLWRKSSNRWLADAVAAMEREPATEGV